MELRTVPPFVTTAYVLRISLWSEELGFLKKGTD